MAEDTKFGCSETDQNLLNLFQNLVEKFRHSFLEELMKPF